MRKSKFNYETFYTTDSEFATVAVNKNLYSFSEALHLAKHELNIKNTGRGIVRKDGFAWFGFGVFDGERENNWWIKPAFDPESKLQNKKPRNAINVWLFTCSILPPIIVPVESESAYRIIKRYQKFFSSTCVIPDNVWLYGYLINDKYKLEKVNDDTIPIITDSYLLTNNFELKADTILNDFHPIVFRFKTSFGEKFDSLPNTYIYIITALELLKSPNNLNEFLQDSPDAYKISLFKEKLENKELVYLSQAYKNTYDNFYRLY